MSVPEFKRGEGKFEVIVNARNLVTYTLQICTNDKIFLPKYQNAITNDLIEEAKDVFICCFTANNIKVGANGEGYQKRKELQNEACNHCNTLLALIQVAQPIFHLKLKRIEYWGRMIVEVRNQIRAWSDSDRKRFS